MSIKVAIIQRRLAHYRVPLYKELQKSFSDLAITLFCGKQKREIGGSGIIMEGDDPKFVKRVNNLSINLFGRTFLFQSGAFNTISKIINATFYIKNYYSIYGVIFNFFKDENK